MEDDIPVLRTIWHVEGGLGLKPKQLGFDLGRYPKAAGEGEGGAGNGGVEGKKKNSPLTTGFVPSVSLQLCILFGILQRGESI